LAAFMLFSV